MFPVKHTVIYTFFAITSVQNTCFCSVFNALASKNLAKSCYVQCFFHFWPFFHCRKATKMTQNSISIPSCAQTPKNPRKMSKTPPYSGLGAKPFLGPPAKADIATAILTNVIEHLVLLLPPNKHAFTAKAVWADFRLVKYYNLPRYYRHISVRFVNFSGELTTLQGLTMARCLQDFVPGCPGETTCSGRIGTPGWQAPSRCGMVSFVAQFFGDPNKVLDRKKSTRECSTKDWENFQSYLILSRYDII